LGQFGDPSRHHCKAGLHTVEDQIHHWGIALALIGQLTASAETAVAVRGCVTISTEQLISTARPWILSFAPIAASRLPELSSIRPLQQISIGGLER
jgi:hypothetical protein